MEKLMTIDEVSELLNMRKGQIYQMTFRKRIPYLKDIGGLRFRRKDIEEWLESNTIRPEPKIYTGKKRGRPKRTGISDERIDKMIENARRSVLA